MSYLDHMTDRVTNEDMIAFSKLKVWSAQPQVIDHNTDCNLLSRLANLSAIYADTNGRAFVQGIAAYTGIDKKDLA